MMNQVMELQIDATLPSFITNFEDVRLSVQERLKTYDIAVNYENLPEAKKLATELNFFAKKINEKRIEKQKEASAPIEILKSQADELIKLFNEGREKLLSQIKVFEDEKRNLCLKLLQEELAAQYEKTGIEPEFRTVKLEDLAILSNLTDTGGLGKKAKNEVTSRINFALALQGNVKNRLVMLENACLKAGLKAPLERKHVEGFLKEPEELYTTKLQGLIAIEVRRQAEIEARLLKQEVAKPETPTPQTQIETETKAEPERKREVDILDEIEEPQKPEKQRFKITAHFEIECAGETSGTLQAKYLERLREIFKSLKAVEVNQIN